MKLIIQIPCYNEAETLEIALNDLPRHIDGIDEIEYLIINDGSDDDTERIALEWGVHYVVHFKRNLGLAKGFLAGIDLALRNGADIIVNTDADNQYSGADIGKLVQPILEKKADIVIGERPIDEIEEFSFVKKKLQRLGSWVVRAASKTDIPDAPSGFRAYSKKAAMRVNVHNEYTYTLETIVQAGRNKMAITSVPVHTNPELRKSRLMNSMGGYIKKSDDTARRFDVQADENFYADQRCVYSVWHSDRRAVFAVLFQRGRLRPYAVTDSGGDDDYYWFSDTGDRNAGRYHLRKPQTARGRSVSSEKAGAWAA